MGSTSSFFSLTPSQSADRLIGHLAEFLSLFPLYAHGERAGEMAGDAGAMMLVHAAVLSGDSPSDLLSSHLFLAGTSLLAFSNPQLFANSMEEPGSASGVEQWLKEFASGIEGFEALPHEDPILAAPDTSFDFLDCAAYGALHKSLEVLQEASLPPAAQAKLQLDIAIVLLEVAIDYDLHMGHVDHALATWGSLAMLSTIDIAMPASVKVPYEYRRLLVNYLRSLADNYALSKDFAFLFTS